MNQMVEQFSEWLEGQKGKKLFIKKGEHSTGMEKISDLDTISISLESISLRQSKQSSLDDYLPHQELILHGNGEIRGNEKDSPLPNQSFEIPLDETFHFSKEGNAVNVHTEKAVYHLSPH